MLKKGYNIVLFKIAHQNVKGLFLPPTKEMRRPIYGEATSYPGGCMALRKLHNFLKVLIHKKKNKILQGEEKNTRF